MCKKIKLALASTKQEHAHTINIDIFIKHIFFTQSDGTILSEAEV